jgi:DNA-binding Lrp family transcriptional regulator
MSYKLDKVDIGIIKLLQQNAKMKVKEIAFELGLTYTPIFDRIKKIEAEGYIKGYTVVLDTEKLGYNLTALCAINLEKHILEQITLFEKEVMLLEGVIECYHIAGAYDYLLKIQVKDMAHYQQFLAHDLAKVKNISRIQSSFVMSEVVSDRGVRLV